MDITNTPTPDPDIQRAFDWLISFLPPGEWDKRKSVIEEHIESMFREPENAGNSTKYHRLIGPGDRIGWYLYLVDTSQHEPCLTEVNQAARVLPIFQRFGMDLDKLLKIGGIDEQAKKVLGGSKSQPDSVIFEMLIALLWFKNGWRNVTFIPPTPRGRLPDIRASNGREEWFIEVKRLHANSNYSVKERDKWLRMWDHLKECLVAGPYPFILDSVCPETCLALGVPGFF